MKKDFNLSLSPKQASDETYYRPIIASKLGVDPEEITAIVVRRRSIDARQRQIKINLGVAVYLGEQPESYNFV